MWNQSHGAETEARTPRLPRGVEEWAEAVSKEAAAIQGKTNCVVVLILIPPAIRYCNAGGWAFILKALRISCY
jgi:hypothetical protein